MPRFFYNGKEWRTMHAKLPRWIIIHRFKSISYAVRWQDLFVSQKQQMLFQPFLLHSLIFKGANHNRFWNRTVDLFWHQGKRQEVLVFIARLFQFNSPMKLFTQNTQWLGLWLFFFFPLRSNCFCSMIRKKKEATLRTPRQEAQFISHLLVGVNPCTAKVRQGKLRVSLGNKTDRGAGTWICPDSYM